MALGEILQKALLNTALGMGTVFCMLIFISLVISCFRFIPKPKAKDEPTQTGSGLKQTDPNSEDDDLIPVIMAAIMASKGVAPDSATGDEPAPYVVRSIRRIS
ncbi:MAG: OadG family protein [Eubacteriaceae bacterium]|nr:OadG family protein [Eubacteriaceae bacterium]